MEGMGLILKKIFDFIEEFFLKIMRKIGLGKLVDFYEQHREGMRYLIFGVLTTLVNIVTYYLCFYIAKIDNGISNVIAWIVSATFAYITNKFCVFDSKVNTKKALLYEIVSFYGCRLLTLAIDEGLMILTFDKLKLNALLMKIVVNVIVIILNFIFSKIIIFKKKDK